MPNVIERKWLNSGWIWRTAWRTVKSVEESVDEWRNLRHRFGVYAELLYARNERRAFESHTSGSAVSATNASCGLFQNAYNFLPLIPFPRPGGENGRCVVASQFAQRNLQRCAASENYRTLDEIFELANVSWPMPSRQLLDGRGGNRFDLLLHSLRIFLREIAHQQRNVLRPFAQWRNPNRKNIQAVVEVAAKLALRQPSSPSRDSSRQ